MNLLVSAQFAVPQIPWASLVPIIIVFGGAVFGVLAEASAPAKNRRSLVIGITLLTPLAAGAVLATHWLLLLDSPSSFGEYIEDSLSIAAQPIFVLIAFLVILVMADRSEIGDGAFASQPLDRLGSSDEEFSDWKNYQRSEMFLLTLFSLGGMILFPVADSYVLLFMTLEVMSLPFYILAATARKCRWLSQETDLKYSVLGAFALAFLLMGSAFLYDFSDSLMISTFVNRVALDSSTDWLILIGVFLVMLGPLFRAGAAPFHAWTPDVYTGVPTPVTGFTAAAVKVTAFPAMLRFYEVAATILQWDPMPVLMGAVFLTMLIGTFTGIVQSDVKRMFVFSSIAHAGFIFFDAFSLVKLLTGYVLFYVIAYGIAAVGASGVVSLVRSTNEEGVVGPEATALQRWAGLGKKNPLMAGAMLVFLLSFAGIPLSAGFVGRSLVFSDALVGGFGWLVGFTLTCSTITASYYLRLVRLMSFTEVSPGARAAKSEGLAYLTVLAAAAATILSGVFPGSVLLIFSQVVVLLP